jgi:hypothetical protein
VIDQVMKNASCHDEKMEAYCNAVCTLKDKFYGIELNHVPRKYNDELAMIVSGRITVALNVFAQDIVKPSIDLGSAPSNQEEPSGAPSSPAGAEPMDEDPANEPLCSPYSRGMARTRPTPRRRSRPPAQRIGRPNTSPRSTKENSPQIRPKPDASPGRPSRSP